MPDSDHANMHLRDLVDTKTRHYVVTHLLSFPFSPPSFCMIPSHECVYGCRKAYGLDGEEKDEDATQNKSSAEKTRIEEKEE
jgi:hypothetical protein